MRKNNYKIKIKNVIMIITYTRYGLNISCFHMIFISSLHLFSVRSISNGNEGVGRIFQREERYGCH